ncbi:MAG: SDR family NAD(P)-dependent oxidoreductase [Acidobacteriaceae bacterium]|nr:SDR family NAD(P)-dependent oxidoreductase [Acidobacteriaceae bacterium]
MSQTVLVTGASSGIGAATARLFHSSGFTTFGTSRSSSNLPARTDFTMVGLDVTSDASVRDCIDRILSQTGRIDILINNAGYSLNGAAEETSIAEAKDQFETNFFGVVRMVNAVLPHMRQAGAGRIINLGSLVGLLAVPYGAFYCATKFALEAYSESLWYELRPFGIGVSLIEPGFVRTSIGHAARLATGALRAYDGPRDRVIAAIKSGVEKGCPPDLVARSIFSAATSRKPHLRYRVGADARWLPRLRRAVPWNVFASGLRRQFALDAES